MPTRTNENYLPRDAVVVGSWRDVVGAAKDEVVRFMPVWMYLAYACLLLNCELTNFAPARTDLAYTVVFPLAVFVGFYAVRGLRAVDGTLTQTFVAAGLAFSLPLLNAAYHQPSPVTGDALLAWYEYSNFAWAALMMWHAWKTNRSHLALFFGVGLFYGACLENGGIWLGFFDESKISRTAIGPLPAPMATMIGWCVVLYMATFLVWKLREYVPALRRSTVLSAFAVGGFATMLDLQIDPVATAAGCWVWHESLPGWFHGVPLVNFIAWMCALTPFAYVMFRLQAVLGIRDGATWSTRHLKVAMAMVVPTLTLAALVFMATTFVVEGVNGPSWKLLFTSGDALIRFVFGL